MPLVHVSASMTNKSEANDVSEGFRAISTGLDNVLPGEPAQRADHSDGPMAVLLTCVDDWMRTPTSTSFPLGSTPTIDSAKAPSHHVQICKASSFFCASNGFYSY